MADDKSGSHLAVHGPEPGGELDHTIVNTSGVVNFRNWEPFEEELRSARPSIP